MVSVCAVPAREGRSCEHIGGYKTINRIPLPLQSRTTVLICYKILSQLYETANMGGTNKKLEKA